MTRDSLPGGARGDTEWGTWRMGTHKVEGHEVRGHGLWGGHTGRRDMEWGVLQVLAGISQVLEGGSWQR